MDHLVVQTHRGFRSGRQRIQRVHQTDLCERDIPMPLEECVCATMESVLQADVNSSKDWHNAISLRLGVP
jgi:hypothetical protein